MASEFCDEIKSIKGFSFLFIVLVIPAFTHTHTFPFVQIKT